MRKLKCGSCVVCCKGIFIFLHPEYGDDASLYKTQPCDGRTILQHKPNGDCIYLDKGCTIYDRRPTLCREIDCRKIYKKAKRDPRILELIQPDFMAAAKAAIKRSK